MAVEIRNRHKQACVLIENQECLARDPKYHEFAKNTFQFPVLDTIMWLFSDTVDRRFDYSIKKTLL